MTTLVLSLSDEQHQALEQKAYRLGVTAEKLAELSVQELLTSPDDDFEQTANYVLAKNKELYDRLS